MIKVEGGEKEQLAKWQKMKTSSVFSLDVVLMILGFVLFVFDSEIQSFTDTQINYSLYGGVFFVLGLILYFNRRKR